MNEALLTIEAHPAPWMFIALFVLAGMGAVASLVMVLDASIASNAGYVVSLGLSLLVAFACCFFGGC